MTLDEVLAALFPAGHEVVRGPSGTLHGTGTVEGQGKVTVVGIVSGTPLGVDGAILLSGHVLSAVKADQREPIVVLIDTASQNMARRDELMGLNEYLAHLAKSLALAAANGHRTVSVLYGHAAAGAFIASALSAQSLAALPGAEPSVTDLPSISRVTKLPLVQLKELSKSTPIFAPGIEPLFATGAVTERWTAFGSLLWQHLTGLAYLSPSSDIDLLWPVPASFDISSLLFGIAEVQRHARLRIDGEILFPDGGGVNWRELWSAHGAKDRATVLAKTMEGVRLLDLNLLMGAEQVA